VAASLLNCSLNAAAHGPRGEFTVDEAACSWELGRDDRKREPPRILGLGFRRDRFARARRFADLALVAGHSLRGGMLASMVNGTL
jgi:hypothetical protein